MSVNDIERSRVIGDKLGVTWTPANYSPSAVTGYTNNVNQLTSHLKGIDTKLSSVASVVSATVTSGEDVSQYDAVYIDSSVNKVKKACNNITSEMANFFGIVSETGGISNNSSGDVILNGLVTNSSWNWTPFLYVYLSSTKGALTQTPPTNAGQFVVPIGIAMSATSIQVNPQTGWTVNPDVNPVFGVGKLAFTQATGSGTLILPSANAIVTQVVIVVSTPASAAGGSVSVGVSSNLTRDLNSNYVDLTVAGTYIYEPFTDCGSTPLPIVLTVTAGGQTFIGTAYVFYSVPNQFVGTSGFASVNFTQSTSSPTVVMTPPDNAVIIKTICIVDTAGTGNPTLSVGINGNITRDMSTSDNDLTTQGTYLYESYTDCGMNSSPVIMTLTNHNSTGVVGRLYVWYIVPA